MHAINKKQMDQMSPSSSHGKPLYKTCGLLKFLFEMMKSLKFLINGMPCKNNKMPQNLALHTSHEEPFTNDVNKKILHSIKAKFLLLTCHQTK
jgi:hypothetical protein